MSDELKLSEKELDQQEHLTESRLKLLDGPAYLTGNRPQNSLAELMHWTQHEFGQHIKGLGRCSIYIHNKITIDGAFLQFCEEEGISIECMFKDAVTSWKTRFKTEHFMAMGVFKITKGDLSFLHAALFHKGNQNEDEVSFFVIVPDALFYEYINLRNDFDEWEKKRDRGNLEIEVVGGNAIPYTRDLKWADLFLEELPKNQLIGAVEGFLASKDVYLRHKVPWKKGIILWGNRGCGKTTALKIIMSVYEDLKPVTVQAGHHAMDEIIDEAFQYAIEHAPSILYFEDLQELLQDIDTSHFLQLLDGVEGRDGLLIVATGNDFSSLEDNIMSRPRRFDKKIEFPLPNKEMSKLYLRRWFGTTLSGERYDEIVLKTVRKKFTYAHLQEIYFSSVYIAIKNDRENPIEDDILKALDEVIIEKRSSDGGLITQTVRKDITDYQGSE